MPSRIALTLALALAAAPAAAQTTSSAPGTANVNPGSVSQESVGGAPNRDTSNAGAAGQAYTGTSSGIPNSPLGTNPLSGGVPLPTGGTQNKAPGGQAGH